MSRPTLIRLIRIYSHNQASTAYYNHLVHGAQRKLQPLNGAAVTVQVSAVASVVFLLSLGFGVDSLGLLSEYFVGRRKGFR